MKAKRLLGAFLAVGLMTVAAAPTAFAAGGKPKKEPAAVVQAEAPTVKKSIDFPISGVAWGMTPKQVALAIDKLIDDDYRPLYKEVQPGVKMKALDAQLAEDKDQFRRGRIDFGALPTGIDSTPLRGEFTYQNKESLMTLNRKGQVTHFFFIQDKLWKVIEEVKLSDAHPLGKTFADAAVKLSAKNGVPGRVLTPDVSRSAVEIDWKDGSTHLRLIQRSDTAVGIAYEDNSTVANLVALRPNKPVVSDGVDPAVAAIMRGGGDNGPPPPPAADKKKPKK
ncbi:MAG: hypothetical protein ABJE95_10880 [Byssovorax sp.]